MGNCASAKSANKQQIPYQLQVKTSIWTKNLHNLFDFESNATTKDGFFLNKPSKIIQVESKIFPIDQFQQVKRQIEIFKIDFFPDKIMIRQSLVSEEEHKLKQKQIEEKINNENKNDNKKQQGQLNKDKESEKDKDKDKDTNQLWYVIRDQKNEETITFDKKHKLEIGDVIKLGRANLKVKDYVIYDQNNILPEDDQNPLTEGQDMDQSVVTGDKHCCRICLSEGSTLENPLLSPCECSGSMKYLHLKCIQKWVQRQFKTRVYNAITVHCWKKLRCELCKIPYKTEFKFSDITYNIIDIPKPKSSYLMLQLNSSDKKSERGIYLIDLSKKDNVRIGRTQDCDVKLNDISVSRTHAILQIEKQSLYIEDCGSKFGTLILLQDKLHINPKLKKKYQLQCGRTLVTLECHKLLKHSPNLNANLCPQDLQIEQMTKEDIEKEFELERKFYQSKRFYKGPPQSELGNKNKQIDEILMEGDLNQQQKYQNNQGVFTDSHGKQGVQLDDIIIYDVGEKHISNHNILNQLQSNNHLDQQLHQQQQQQINNYINNNNNNNNNKNNNNNNNENMPANNN